MPATALVSFGQGAAWLPRSMVAQELEEGKLQHLDFMSTSASLSIVVHFANYGSEAVKHLSCLLDQSRAPER